ncbi:MAG: FtsX-like permease family protein [Planctomycetes bacterium]|nr:FtsX-like permease family protein [Planctomycetota bacterium]
MNAILSRIRYALRSARRQRMRTVALVAGVALTTALAAAIACIDLGVRDATTTRAGETKLVVYRENRFCPFASSLPQRYDRQIGELPGVAAVVPVKIVVSNCRASLDVVTFRGVPEDDLRAMSPRLSAGSIDAWVTHGNGALVGRELAARRGLRVGSSLSAAGIEVVVDGILESDDAQWRNSALTHLSFLQERAARGGTGGIVTQFDVTVSDPSRLEEVARSIDDRFRSDESPTATRPQTAFVARAARDVVALAGFSSMIGIGAVLAAFGLLATTMINVTRHRAREFAVLRTLGFTDGGISTIVLGEGALVGALGGLLGAGSAWLILSKAGLAFAMEGVSIAPRLDGSIFALAAAAAFAAGLLATAVPAWTASRAQLVDLLRGGS